MSNLARAGKSPGGASIAGTVQAGLCSGCGACAGLAPDVLEMIDIVPEGRRPILRPGMSEDGVSEILLAICPGVSLEHDYSPDQPGLMREFAPAWGPIFGVWEGYASDPAIRYAGSSGGAATALAWYCIDSGGMHGVLHTAARQDAPHLNETVFSRTREELLSATGSRYAPASPCDGLQQIVDAPGPCVFIGKPCDVAAMQKARKLRPDLDAKLGVTIAFFCAGTPSTQGTLEMLKRMGIDDPAALVSLRYRGNGWPGKATAVVRTDTGEETRQLTYEQAWGEVLSRYQQWRCKLCADHTGEFADIAVADPWYRTVQDDEPGQSLVLARSERGREIILAAAEAGYLHIEAAEPRLLPASQPNLLKTRGAVWGRLLACRMMGVPSPRYSNMPLFRHWWRELGWRQKARSVLGMIRRIRQRQAVDGRGRRP